MTTAIDTTTSIAAPPDVVWAALTDWSLAPRWMPGVTAMTGPLEHGAVVTFTVRGKERTAVVETLDVSKAITGTHENNFAYLQTPAAIPQGSASSVFAGYYLPGEPFGSVSIVYTTD